MKKEVSKVEKVTPELMIQNAINKGLDVGTIERLMAMRTQIKEEYAREEFYKALAEFQKECPVIKKTKVVMNKDGKSVRYRYAPIDSIVEQTRELISKNGFSYNLRTITDLEGKHLTAVCQIYHEGGHTDESRFTIPVGTEEYMSDSQKYAARQTFAKRYAFCNAFGIMTGDEELEEAVDNNTMNKALVFIKTATADDLDDWQDKFEKSKKYTEEQKKELVEAIQRRRKEME